MQRLVCLLALFSGSQALHSCYQCTHTLDSINETYGVGQEECWDSDDIGVGVPCNSEEEICLTRILVQWNGAGHQLSQISRGCGVPPDLHCHSASIGGIQMAECHQQCQSDMCNDANSVIETSYMFNLGDSIESCEACRHYENENGDASGNMNCKETSNQNKSPCPGYANKGCYTATSVSYDKNNDQEVWTDRGCSAFIMDNEDGYECTYKNSEGTSFDTCKETCQSEDCNTGSPSYEIDTSPGNMCLSCSVTVDQNNNTVGAGNIGCWYGDENLGIQCESNEVCLTMMEVDWVARGSMQYTVRRRCTNKDTQEPPCLEGETSLIKYKDCYHQCNPSETRPNCNSGLNEVGDKFYDPMQNVQTCYACEFSQKDNGDMIGYEACSAEIGVNNDANIPVHVCPKFASKTCYEASTTHFDYMGSTEEIDEDYRGCSPFKQAYACDEMELNELKHTTCKNSCSTNNCNKDAHQTRHQCYSCTGTWDNSGGSAGVSDDRCWDPEQFSDRMLADCEADELYCVDDLTVDWFLNGQQVSIITRGCSKDPAKPIQEESNEPFYSLIDMQTSCESTNEGGCNNNMDVANLNKGDQRSCFTCYDKVHADGSVEGNKNCPDDQSSSSKKQECPAWASQGCFTSTASHYVQGNNRIDAYRGCSAFNMKHNGNDYDENSCYGGMFPDVDGVQSLYNMCKTTCKGIDCNKDETQDPNLDTDVPLCQVCSVTVDQYNRTVGNGDLACWTGSKKFNQPCPNADDKCITEMEADWYPRGMIQYNMKRGCAAKVPDTCLTGSSSLLSYKDCAVECEPRGNSGCNDGIQEVAEKFAQFNKNVESCYTCQYFQSQADGHVEGHADCSKNPQRVGSRTCPLYAQAACMEAASFHLSYDNDNSQIEDDFRGCSPFILEEDYVCKTAEADGLTHRNCKNTCKRDDCNDGPLSSGHSCYSCAATRDSSGISVGTSDDRCFDSVHDNQDLVQDCAPGEDYCVDELLVDWLPKGDQYATIRRGCSSKKPADSCIDNQGMALLKYKDCFHYCEDNACNYGMEAADGFLPNKQDQSTGECYSCKYVEHDWGTAEGNSKCVDQLPGTDLKHTCAMYQHVSCFTAATKHTAQEGTENEGETIEQIYKGCSSFVLKDGFEIEDTQLPSEIDGTMTGYIISRTTCAVHDNCNSEHLDVSGKPPVANCQQCQVTVNMQNRTIGVGDSGCWLGDANSYTQECPAGQPYCATDMLIDWIAAGEIQYRIKRGCSSIAPNEITECESASSSLMEYKDCQVTCDPASSGDGCNTGLDQVSSKFTEMENPIGSCYECLYKQRANGNVHGLRDCGLAAEESGLEPRACPAYANRACYFASATHLNYQDPKESFEDDYRGCSPFGPDDDHPNAEFHCELVQLDGFKHEICKGSCNTTECNGEAFAAPKNLCYTCTVTLDSKNDVVFGSRQCWNAPPDATDLIAECSNEEPYCIDEIYVDWYGVGYQYTTLKRSCAAQPAISLCEQAESSRVKYKDCMHSCKIEEEGLACNNNVTRVQEKFVDPDYRQNECFACNYIEQDNGEVAGNENCRDLDKAGPEVDIDRLIRECPLHASAGCYTGAAIHDVSGADKEEVYKGCSAFYIDDPFFEMTTEELPDGFTYNLAKETCRGPSCNYKTLHPWPSGEEGTTTTKPGDSTTTTASAEKFIISTVLLILTLLF